MLVLQLPYGEGITSLTQSIKMVCHLFAGTHMLQAVDVLCKVVCISTCIIQPSPLRCGCSWVLLMDR